MEVISHVKTFHIDTLNNFARRSEIWVD